MTRTIKKFRPNINKWIDLTFNADKSDSYQLICIPEEKREPFYLIENKDTPVKVRCDNDKVIICWAGALKIGMPESIQRLRLNYISAK